MCYKNPVEIAALIFIWKEKRSGDEMLILHRAPILTLPYYLAPSKTLQALLFSYRRLGLLLLPVKFTLKIYFIHTEKLVLCF